MVRGGGGGVGRARVVEEVDHVVRPIQAMAVHGGDEGGAVDEVEAVLLCAFFELEAFFAILSSIFVPLVETRKRRAKRGRTFLASKPNFIVNDSPKPRLHLKKWTSSFLAEPVQQARPESIEVDMSEPAYDCGTERREDRDICISKVGLPSPDSR